MGYEVKHGKCYSPKYNDGTIAPMQFDRSWDWLMPVVIKIGKSGNIVKAMHDLREYSSLRTIEDVYRAVVEIIKEYNDGEQ